MSPPHPRGCVGVQEDWTPPNHHHHLPVGGGGEAAKAFVATLLRFWGIQVTSDLTPNRRSTGGQRGGHREVGQEVENLVRRKDGDGEGWGGGGWGVKQSLQK